MLNTSEMVAENKNDSTLTPLIFSITLFLSATLLFIMQPMAAKRLLPIFGGTPAVWTVCMFFFQASLVLAYAYAWCISHISQSSIWRFGHLTLCCLSMYALPTSFDISKATLTTANESFFLLKTLITALGLPLLVICSTAPLLQFAYSKTHAPNAHHPYFLYVTSNLGSLFALFCYPTMIERLLQLEEQFHFWDYGYGLYVFFLATLLLFVPYKTKACHETTIDIENRADLTQKKQLMHCLHWCFLSFIPSSLMLGVTTYISTDIAATPLLWVIPLALYLLSFSIAFAQNAPNIFKSYLTYATPFAVATPFLVFVAPLYWVPVWIVILLLLGSFFWVSLWCQCQLVRNTPPASKLTLFYLCCAIGGMLGGLFNSLIAPNTLSHAYEYPLIMTILLFYWGSKQPIPNLLRKAILIATPLLFWFETPDKGLTQQRNFYGSKRVFSQNQTHYLLHQTTLHGFQIQTPEEKTNGTVGYYGPIGPAIQLLKASEGSIHATILGLGAGTLFCQFQSDDFVSAIEIDPQVIAIASNPQWFSYVKHCLPQKKIIQQDGRLALHAFKNKSQNLIILDAFSSDAIPVHLLTQEAFMLYQQKLASNGIILVNASNRHLDIIPVTTAIAHAFNLIQLIKQGPSDPAHGQLASQWVMLTNNESLAARLMQTQQWRFEDSQKSILWTDEYSNLLPLVRL